MIELDTGMRDEHIVQWFERRMRRIRSYFELGDTEGFKRETELLHDAAWHGYIMTERQDSDNRPYIGR